MFVVAYEAKRAHFISLSSHDCLLSIAAKGDLQTNILDKSVSYGIIEIFTLHTGNENVSLFVIRTCYVVYHNNYYHHQIKSQILKHEGR